MMTTGKKRLVVGGSAALVALSACAAAGAGDAPSEETGGGSVEVAASEVCEPGSSPECVAVGEGESVLLEEARFVRAGVVDASAVEEDEHALILTFDEEGQAALESTTVEVAEGGGWAHMVLRAGDVILSAAEVVEPLVGNEPVQVVLSDEMTADEAIDLISGD